MAKRYGDPKTALEAARSPATSATDLRMLAGSALNFVREAVAENPSTPPEVLATLLPRTLTSEDDFRIGGSLLRNPISQREIVAHIATLAEKVMPQFLPRHFYPMLLFEALAANPRADAALLAGFLDPLVCPTHLRERLARLSVQPEVLGRLAADRSETVRRRAIRRLEHVV